jgi:hypothetical protein
MLPAVRRWFRQTGITASSEASAAAQPEHRGALTPPVGSDKDYWHRYPYEPVVARVGSAPAILEFGVLHGDSIRSWARRFPEARIIGADILPQQPEWPVAANIRYVQLDQGRPEQIEAMCREAGPFDLIVEDGSHLPLHQRHCLVTTLPYLRAGGIYILEDIHTSHPSHRLYRGIGEDATIGPLHLLLALEHRLATGGPADAAWCDRLSRHSLFTSSEVQAITARLQSIELYRRATLPLQCYQCGRADRFDFGHLRCACGALLYEEADSMTAILGT